MNTFYNFFRETNFQVEMAACLDVGPEWNSMVNIFQYARVYYIRSGNAQLILTDGILNMEEGNVYILPAFSILGGNCSDQMEHYFIHLIPDMMTEYFLKLLPLKKKCPMPQGVADYLFTVIAMNYNKDNDYSKIVTENSLKLIFSGFLSDVHLDNTNQHHQIFSTIFEYIEKHIDEKIELKDLAALVYLNEVYLSNLFKKAFGISLQQFILNKKADKAKALLSTEMSISDIGVSLNFYDPSAFSAFFKKHTGFTPTDFRKRLFNSDQH